MLRARRYRIVLLVTTIFVLIIIHSTRSNNWSSSTDIPELHAGLPEPYRAPVSGSDVAVDPPEYPLAQALEELVPPEAGTSPQEPPSEDSNNSADTATVTAAEEKASIAEADQGESILQKNPSAQELETDTASKGQTEISDPDRSRPAVHWEKLPEHFPVRSDEMIKLPTGRSKAFPKLQAKFKDESVTDKITRMQRLASIKEVFKHSWAGYKAQAMGHDEMNPVKGGYQDPFNGWGATLVDALDTLWIMDLKSEFSFAVGEVGKIDFTTSSRPDIPLFETTIRYLGGLLGAYDISGQKYTVLLEKARELADILIGAFDTPNRMPMLYYKWAPEAVSVPHVADRSAVLAEIGSLSLEFTRLAQLTREDKYYDAIARVTNKLEEFQDSTQVPGLWPLRLNATGCRMPVDLKSSAQHHDSSPAHVQERSYLSLAVAEYDEYHVGRRDSSGLSQDAQPADYDQLLEEDAQSDDVDSSSDGSCEGVLTSTRPGADTFGLGALADSTYEYMPKEYMLLGGLNEQYRTMYKKAMNATREYLLFQPMVKDGRDLRFVSTVTLTSHSTAQSQRTWSYAYEGSHLACFVGGMFGVGARLFEIDGDLDLAARLTDGCVWAYESTVTGIMPETFELLPCERGKPCTWNETRYGQALDPRPDQTVLDGRPANRRDTLPKKLNSAVEEGNQAIPKLPVATVLGGTPEATQTQRGLDAVHGGRASSKPIDSNLLESNVAASVLSSDSAAQDWKRSTAQNAGVSRDESIPATEHGLASRDLSIPMPHEEFVQTRIRNERIPPGFVRISSRKYHLRPEAIESVFVMYRLTGESHWREKGWKMFEAVSKHTRTELGNSAIRDVTEETPQYDAVMESFWLAETLKYSYLLFSDPEVVSLDKYVLNTEAHPFRRPLY